MNLSETLIELMKKHKISEIVQTLADECEEKAKVDKENQIEWQESESALRGSLDRITSYGM